MVQQYAVRVPLVSVIVPTYNQATFLPAAIASVVEQTFPSWEIIVVDDGSTDHTPSVLDELTRRVPGLRVVPQQNAGRSAARNAGIRLARGRYLVFLIPTTFCCHTSWNGR
jgi:glycosyltransferase involved in cell wall biosynthesis